MAGDGLSEDVVTMDLRGRPPADFAADLVEKLRQLGVCPPGHGGSRRDLAPWAPVRWEADEPGPVDAVVPRRADADSAALLPPGLTAALGFDLGDGDTVVSRMRRGNLSVPTELPIDSNQICVPTAVAQHVDGPVVGRRALLLPGTRGQDINFKSRFAPNGSAMASTVDFVTGVRTGLIRHGAHFPAADTVAVVGYPAGWRTPALTSYLQVFRDVLDVAAVCAVPESRAVLFALRHAGELDAADLAHAVLIVDLGSSTLDMTAVESLRAREITVGEGRPLGAAVIDRTLLGLLLDRHGKPGDEEHLRSSPEDLTRMLVGVREAKERLFDHVPGLVDPDVDGAGFELPFPPMPHLDKALDVRHWTVSPADVRDAVTRPVPELAGLSWRDRFRLDMAHALAQVPDDGHLKVCLTGGGSRMGFVVDVIRDLIGRPPRSPCRP